MALFREFTSSPFKINRLKNFIIHNRGLIISSYNPNRESVNMSLSIKKDSIIKPASSKPAIETISLNSGESRSSPNILSSDQTNFGRSLFGTNFINETFAKADPNGPVKFATTSWTAATKAQESSAGTVDVTGRKINSDPTSANYSINPNTFDSINPLDYYGHNGFGVGGAGGDAFDFARAKRFNIADTQIASDSKLLELMPDKNMANKLWNEIRGNLVAGADGRGLFANDEFLNKALNETIDKFLSGPKGKQHEFQNAIKNNDVLSTVTAFRISKEGIHKNGLGKLYEAYAKVDNSLPDNIINAAYLSKFHRELKTNGGNVVAALEAAKHLDNKTYGELDVNSDQVKAFANKVNQATFKSMAESLGLDANKLEQTLKDKGGVDGENKFYDISGAIGLASTQDFSLLETVDGKSGFQRLVEMSKPREDGKNHEAHVNFHIRPKGNANTDGTAFLDFSQNGIEALASLQKHVGGLTDNLMLPNQFSFVFQDENNFKEWAPKILEEMKKTDIDVTKIGFNIEGHGSRESGAMINSGVVGRDYQGIGQDDSAFMASLLDHADKVRQVEVNYDSCQSFEPSKHNAEAIAARAKQLGMNIAVTHEGSVENGLVLAESGGEKNNRDRFTMNADGSLSAGSQRIDDGGTDQRKTIYTQSEESFNQAMKVIQEERNKNSSDNPPA